MVGWMDDEALHRTLTTGRATYFSRSRQDYWRKGDTSGHVQWVKEVRLDCDGDTVLVRVDQVGPACHTGAPHLLRRRAARGLPTRSGGCAVSTGAVAPTLEEFRVAGRDRRVIPVVRRLMADAETPVGLYRKLAQDRPGHLPARVGRARWSVVALLDRRSQIALRADRGRRTRGVDRRRAAGRHPPRW